MIKKKCNDFEIRAIGFLHESSKGAFVRHIGEDFLFSIAIAESDQVKHWNLKEPNCIRFYDFGLTD